MEDNYSRQLEQVSHLLSDANSKIKGNNLGDFSLNKKIPIQPFIYIGIVLIVWFLLGYFKPTFIMDENDKKEGKEEVAIDKQLICTVLIAGIISGGFYWYTHRIIKKD